MITEKQIRLEMEIGYDLLSSHLEIRNQIIDLIMRQYKEKAKKFRKICESQK